MAKTKFCSDQYIKENSTVNVEILSKKISAAVNLAQDKYIVDVLGTGLYNELEGQISGETLTALNRTLLVDYVQPTLLWFTIYELYLGLRVKFNDAGVQVYETENQKAIEKKEFEDHRNEAKNNAEYYAQKVTDYLVANSTSYPLFYNPGTSSDTVSPNLNNFHGGMYFPESWGYTDIGASPPSL